MMASLMCHSQVIKAPQEIYEDAFSYRKFQLVGSKSFFSSRDKEVGKRE